MSSRADSTPTPAATPKPDAWEELQPFRAVFLLHLTGTREGRALRLLAKLAYQMLLDWPHLHRQYTQPLILEQLRAVREDLRYTSGYLRHVVGESARDLDTDRQRRAVAARVAFWELSLGVVVDDVEKALRRLEAA